MGRIVFLWFLFLGVCFAENADVNVLEFKFGEVIAGEQLEHVFVLPRVRVISSVTSCECISLHFLERENATLVKLKFNTADYSGAVEHYGFVATDKGNFKLTITAWVFSGALDESS